MKYVILHPSTVCIKKEAMVNLGGFDNHLTHGEDLDLWFRAMSKLSGVFIDTETVTVDISAENRAMHKQLTYKTHILNIVERHRDNSIQYKNEYLDLYILKNCIPFYFGKDKMTIISKFEDILRGPKVSFYWKIVYSEKLYLLNRTMYFSYKAIKYKWRITRNIFFQKSTKY
jgi:hypothetical protein